VVGLCQVFYFCSFFSSSCEDPVQDHGRQCSKFESGETQRGAYFATATLP
jgi:hypothetical protein